MVYRTKADGSREVVPNHPLYRLLHDSPNYDQTAADFWEFKSASVELWGNAYSRKIRERGRIVAPVDVLRFDGVPHAGCSSYATVGLSEHLLDGRYRLELIMAVGSEVKPPLPVLVRVGEEIISRHAALLRGDVVKVGGGGVEWLYATVPVYYPDALAQVDGVAVVWLVPVSDSEARFVKQHGWDPFEDRLAEADPDLTDLRRSPVV